MVNKKKENDIPKETIALYDMLIHCLPGVERKGATMPYTAINGNMFSFINKEGLLSLRLSSDQRNKFIEKYKTALCIEHGTVMKEYVRVPESLFMKTEELKPWFKLSFEYAKALKPKSVIKK